MYSRHGNAREGSAHLQLLLVCPLCEFERAHQHRATFHFPSPLLLGIPLKSSSRRHLSKSFVHSLSAIVLMPPPSSSSYCCPSLVRSMRYKSASSPHHVVSKQAHRGLDPSNAIAISNHPIIEWRHKEVDAIIDRFAPIEQQQIKTASADVLYKCNLYSTETEQEK